MGILGIGSGEPVGQPVQLPQFDRGSVRQQFDQRAIKVEPAGIGQFQCAPDAATAQ